MPDSMGLGTDLGSGDPGDGPRDSPPEAVLAAAKSAFSRERPAEIASLVYDSLVDGDDGPELHRLRFEHPRLGIEIAVSATPAGTTIAGHLRPPLPARVELVFEPGDVALVVPDARGSFEFGPLGHGLVRVSVSGEGRPPVATDLFRV